MSQCDAVVVEVTEREVLVEVAGRASACGGCKSADACENSLLGLGTGPRRYRLDKTFPLRIGDRVSLDVAEGSVLRASVASYVIPLLLAIGGAAAGQSAGGEAWSVAGTLLGLACGVAWLRARELKARKDGQLYSLQLTTKEIRFREPS